MQILNLIGFPKKFIIFRIFVTSFLEENTKLCVILHDILLYNTLFARHDVAMTSPIAGCERFRLVPFNSTKE